MDPSSIVGPVWEMTKCLCGRVKTEASYVYDLEENLQSLEGKSQKLEDMKKDVETVVEEEETTREMQRSHQVSGWLKRVQSIQQEIKDIQVRGTKQIQNKCLSKYCPKNCISSNKLGKKVDKILRNVDELGTEGERFLKDFKIALRHLHKSNEMLSGETVGLNLTFDKMCRSIEEGNVGIIGLYGMGGVGKTTLLKKINNELGKRSDFYIIWVVVSKSPNFDTIMDIIRKSVGIGDDLWKRCSNQEEKAIEIYEILKKKKFVLLLDDVWERLDLEKVGVPHPKETNFQSKVLFTTRFEDVCAKMKAQRKFKVEILTEKEALELFLMKVGEETLKSNPIIPKIAEEMAKECKGLPLALTVVGSAMAGVQSVESWEWSKNNFKSSSWTALDLGKSVLSILKFSYDQLPDETHKKCFLYCALYPEDYEIRVYDLIEKWIGEGFLHNDRLRTSVHDMHSYGGFIIEKLKLSCLLENVEDDIFLERSIKMHDVIRDMALWISRDEDRNKNKVIVQEDIGAITHANVENWEMAERISIMNGAESCIQSIAWTNLTTLLLKFDTDFDAISGLQNIQYARQLKVLELYGLPNVPITEIGGLNCLEYLLLEGVELMKVSNISRELRNLKNLKVFYLYMYHDVIPLGLTSNLQQLKVFRFGIYGSSTKERDERDEREFLEELECSSNLEELWIQITTESGLNKLFKLAKLQSCIYGLVLSHVRAQVNWPLLMATMSKMKHLQCLVLYNLFNVIDPSVSNTCCLSTIRRVQIFYCDTVHHLTWLKYAPLLQELIVSDCLSIEEVIKGEQLVEDDQRDAIFDSLVELQLINLGRLKSIHKRVLSFPSLKSIQVHGCGNLNKLPMDSNSAKAKLRLISGSQSWWNNLEWDDPSIKATFQSKFQAHKYY
ncbi:hypothetical protein QN277_001833 [Acacia crassicarpa]|uniref:AAA+ ATPase domain-containing protein n=1 Tax=Acacia crassicarpa TaxID=499986 RepID=A0AAE1N7Y9_9FABA|nr:hypothetical protein QN277_001833 [Acacia crassicarpa]